MIINNTIERIIFFISFSLSFLLLLLQNIELFLPLMASTSFMMVSELFNWRALLYNSIYLPSSSFSWFSTSVVSHILLCSSWVQHRFKIKHLMCIARITFIQLGKGATIWLCHGLYTQFHLQYYRVYCGWTMLMIYGKIWSHDICKGICWESHNWSKTWPQSSKVTILLLITLQNCAWFGTS